MGEDGNLILFSLNEYQQNRESKIKFHDEVLAKEVLLKEQVILFLMIRRKKSV